MSSRIDPRLEARRRRVAEDRARTRFGRLLALMVVLGLGAAGTWVVLRSPWLAVSEVTVEGAGRVDVPAVLAREGLVVPGLAMIGVDPSVAEEVLEADPWVAEAEVARRWPDRVVVRLEERSPVAWMEFSDGWALVAPDGVVLAAAEAPGPRLPIGRFPATSAQAGPSTATVIGGVEFLASLPPQVRPGAVVQDGPDGLGATVAGFDVRLGQPADMEEKARSLVGLLRSGVDEGSVITVVAPAYPAVLPPGGEAADAEEVTDGPP